jgi:hypothetical protein
MNFKTIPVKTDTKSRLYKLQLHIFLNLEKRKSFDDLIVLLLDFYETNKINKVEK